jgi:hypothetical protein
VLAMPKDLISFMGSLVVEDDSTIHYISSSTVGHERGTMNNGSKSQGSRLDISDGGTCGSSSPVSENHGNPVLEGSRFEGGNSGK